MACWQNNKRDSLTIIAVYKILQQKCVKLALYLCIALFKSLKDTCSLDKTEFVLNVSTHSPGADPGFF